MTVWEIIATVLNIVNSCVVILDGSYMGFMLMLYTLLEITGSNS